MALADFAEKETKSNNKTESICSIFSATVCSMQPNFQVIEIVCKFISTAIRNVNRRVTKWNNDQWQMKSRDANELNENHCDRERERDGHNKFGRNKWASIPISTDSSRRIVYKTMPKSASAHIDWLFCRSLIRLSQTKQKPNKIESLSRNLRLVSDRAAFALRHKFN